MPKRLKQIHNMAVFVAATVSESRQYNGKITWFVVLSSLIAATGGIIFGYDIGISGGVTSMEPFLRKFFPQVYHKMKEDSKISNYCKFDSQLLTSFTSSLYVAGLIACFFASTVTRVFGRKPSILIGGASFLTGAALGGAASNIYMLLFGRVLLGVGLGFSNQSVPLYLSEIAPARFRGAFNMSFQVCVGVGVFSANLLNYGTAKIKGGWGWRVSLAMAAAPALVLTIGALFLPETPNSIIHHANGHEKAKKILQKVRGTEDVQAELEDLHNLIEWFHLDPWFSVFSTSMIRGGNEALFFNIAVYQPTFSRSLDTRQKEAKSSITVICCAIRTKIISNGRSAQSAISNYQLQPRNSSRKESNK